METLYKHPTITLYTLRILIAATTLCPSIMGQTVKEKHFLQEPRNATVMEGEMIKFNCSSMNNILIAIWIINGTEYSLSDLLSIPTYTFDLQDNSLTINSAQKALDGTSFQCVIAQQASEIGYLTVLSADAQMTSSSESTRFFLATNILKSDIDNTDTTVFSTQSLNFEDPTKNIPHRKSSRVYAAVAVPGITAMIVACTIISALSFIIINKCNRKPQSATPPETFTMVTNEVYGNVNQCKMSENEAYNQRSSYLAG